ISKDVTALVCWDVKAAAENGDNEWVANVGVWARNHALNAPHNHLPYPDGLSPHDGVNHVAA
ncbi:hypothetical protein A2U01_0073684, partial [Trifolium medium]|nr:hypothetical protein [Trifolium medium]